MAQWPAFTGFLPENAGHARAGTGEISSPDQGGGANLLASFPEEREAVVLHEKKNTRAIRCSEAAGFIVCGEVLDAGILSLLLVHRFRDIKSRNCKSSSIA